MTLHKSTSYAGKPERPVVDKLKEGKAGDLEYVFGLNCEEKGSKENKLEERLRLHELESQTLKALHELVSLVHCHVDHIGQSEPVISTTTSGSADAERSSFVNFVKENLFCLKDDPVASILWNLHPLSLQNVLMAMAHNFPRTLEGLILHLLSPVGAQVLTQKFDEIDQLTAEEDRNKFYQVFYGAFDDQSVAMDAILGGKESFARQAFKDVLDQYLGVNLD